MHDERFDLSGRVAALTGAGGVLVSAMARELARRGAKVAVLDLVPEAAEKVADAIRRDGGEAIALRSDVLQRVSLEENAAAIRAKWGGIDILVNGAGGNKKEASTSDTLSFFDLPPEAIRFVFDLNLIGSVLPSQVFGKMMAERKAGVIVNTSSMNAFRPLTKIPAYSAAKAAVSNFTQWMAVHMAKAGIRVNAIAPGFFVTDQNRALLTHPDGSMTPRSEKILAHTPMGHFGEPADLIGALLWLVSDQAAGFVTGVVVPIDGGFSAYSGV